MKLIEFRDKIVSAGNAGYHYVLSYDDISAHRKFIQDSYVIISKDNDEVILCDENGDTGTVMDIHEVEGDDWLYYSKDRAVIAGYLSCKDGSNNVWKALRPYNCGMSTDIKGDRISYPQGIFVGSQFTGYDVPRLYAMPISMQCQVNNIRKAYGLKCLPYKNGMGGGRYVYIIGVMNTISKIGNKRRISMCENAIHSICKECDLVFDNVGLNIGLYM